MCSQRCHKIILRGKFNTYIICEKKKTDPKRCAISAERHTPRA
ncbi:GSCOCG00003474001-RA-CDS [Cotesia congregata]|nr:GSCOCG00003474001-RA-CDS [Cotesia congregata]